MRVGGPITSDAGHHFVALVDAETLQPLDELGVAAVDGTYDFHFENVPEGDYLLIAGTDRRQRRLHLRRRRGVRRATRRSTARYRSTSTPTSRT